MRLLAFLFLVLAAAAWLTGCGDDEPGRFFTRCAGRGPGLVRAYHQGGELVCEDAGGTVYASRPLLVDETPDTACSFCLSR